MNSTTVGIISANRENSNRIHSASHRRLGLGFNFVKKRTNIQSELESKELSKKKTVPGSSQNLRSQTTITNLQENQHPYNKFKLKVEKLAFHNFKKKNSNRNSLFQNFSIIAKTKESRDTDRRDMTPSTVQNKNRDGIKSSIGVLSQPGKDVGRDPITAHREIVASMTQIHLVSFFGNKSSEP
jgi:hypothetical protein